MKAMKEPVTGMQPLPLKPQSAVALHGPLPGPRVVAQLECHATRSDWFGIAGSSVARQRDRAPAQSRETVAPCRIDLRVVGIRKKLVGSGCAAAALMSAAAHHGKAPRHDHKAVTR